MKQKLSSILKGNYFNQSSLYKAGINYGSDKLTHHGYDRFYDVFLKQYKTKPINFFEIGIDSGHSLKMWNKYFSRAKIYGMDINHEYVHLKGKIFKGDQSSIKDLKKIKKEISSAGVIIDDGSHVPEHQVYSFNYLFDELLDMGGLYIIEDIETSYWKNSELYGYKIKSGYAKKNNIIEIFKDVADIVNREFIDTKTLKSISEKNQIDQANLKYISFIMFGQNCIIIKKMSVDEYEKYGKRKYRFGVR